KPVPSKKKPFEHDRPPFVRSMTSRSWPSPAGQSR
ncbi:hypothetical protein D030_2452B, partial [Vibrio parahaemolyticus AQ3810]